MRTGDHPSSPEAREREALWILGGLYTFRALGAETGNAYTLVEVLGGDGFAAPHHLHVAETEGFYVLEGDVTFFIGEERIEGSPGSFVFAPVGVQHAFRFHSPQAHMLLVFTPGAAGHEGLFRAIGEPALSHEIPPPSQAPPDLERLAGLAAQHGTKILGPPPGA